MSKKYYLNEKISIIPCVFFIIGLLLMLFFIILKIISPDNWAPYGFLIAITFMFFWTWIAFGFAYYITIKPTFKFLKQRELIIKNGVYISGEIIKIKKISRNYTVNDSKIYDFCVEIKLDNDETFVTPALTFNPENLSDKKVVVYKYNDLYYATDFKIDFKFDRQKKRELIKKEIEDNKEKITKTDYSNSIVLTISGIGLISFFIWIILNSADNTTRIVIIPFLIAGIGIMLSGLIPILFPNKKNRIKNIGSKVYLWGFGIFWFGLLIVFDYVCIQNNNISLIIYSLLFWIVGIFMIYSKYRKL